VPSIINSYARDDQAPGRDVHDARSRDASGIAAAWPGNASVEVGEHTARVASQAS
jgi:hypothetical protein